MSMLVVGFAARMRKWDADLEDEPTHIPDGKHPSVLSYWRLSIHTQRKN